MLIYIQEEKREICSETRSNASAYPLLVKESCSSLEGLIGFTRAYMLHYTIELFSFLFACQFIITKTVDQVA